jgi:transcriptional regulator with XRE-family HTH domain
MQDRLATRAGMNKGYLSGVETGQRVPSLEILLKLCQVLEVPVFDLFVVPDRSPLDRLLEDLRLGGSPAAQALRALQGLDKVRWAATKKQTPPAPAPVRRPPPPTVRLRWPAGASPAP